MWKPIIKTHQVMGLFWLFGISLPGSAEHLPQIPDTDNWQLKQIYHPSKGLLQREERGLVTIYDGLTDIQVDHILDRNFPRIGNMMFTRVRTTDAQTGKDIMEDDGCDD